MKGYLQSLHCHWTFLFGLLFAVAYASYTQSIAWGMICLLCIVRCIMLQKRAVWLFAVIMSVFGIRLWSEMTYIQWQQSWQVTPAEQSYTIRVNPMDIKETPYAYSGIGTMIIEGKVITVAWQLAKSNTDDGLLPVENLQDWQVQAVRQPIEPSRNFYVFDYANYMAQRGVVWTLNIKSVTQSTPVRSMQNIRYNILAHFQRYQSLEWVALHNKLLWNLDSIGYREQRSTFSELGVLHFFAISGFHIYAIHGLLEYCLRRIGVRVDRADVIVTLLISFYAWCIHFPVGVVRVVCMMYAKRFTRYYQLPFSRLDQLAIIGSVTLLVSPSMSRSIGFILSYLMAYILYFFHQNQSSTVTKWQTNVEMTVACLLFSWPIIMQQTHQFQPFQLVWVVIFSVIFTKIIFPLAIVTTVALCLPFDSGMVLLELINHVFKTGYSFVTMIEKVVTPMIVGHLSFIVMLALLVTACMYLQYIHVYRKKVYTMVILSYGVLLGIVPFIRVHDRIVMLDVGQGDALLFQPAWTTQSWLIDTGGKARMNGQYGDSLASLEYAHKTIIPALKALGVRKLTGVIVTHPDMDHLGNLQELVQHIPVAEVIVTPYTQRDNLWLDMVDDFPINTKITTMPHHSEVHNEEIGLSLYTIPNVSHLPQMDSSNDTSIATVMTIGNLKILNLGDLSAEGEKLLLKYYPHLQADIIKIGHHGSKHSTSDELLQHIQPKWVWISAGKGNRYGHPHDEVLSKLATYHIPYISTHEVGAVQLEQSEWGNYQLTHVLPQSK